jgi:hypothetical protein
MPKDQLYQQLRSELGEDWRSKFQEFDDVPIAAASIGQVPTCVPTIWCLVNGIVMYFAALLDGVGRCTVPRF